MRASTKPATLHTRRCLDTQDCGILSRRSILPTQRSDAASRRRMVRRFGSAMIANEDSMRRIYLIGHIHVKSHSGAGPGGAAAPAAASARPLALPAVEGRLPG